MQSDWIYYLISALILFSLGLFIFFRTRKPKDIDATPTVPAQIPPAPLEKPTIPPPPSLTQPVKKSRWGAAAQKSFFGLFSSSSAATEKIWEKTLIEADLGPRLTAEVLKDLGSAKENPKDFLKSKLESWIEAAETTNFPWRDPALRPFIVFVVGVNGAGKTTTLAKLAHYFKETEKLSVGLVAADTFRKAAIEQLETWANRLQVPFFSLQGSGSVEGADPSAVAFDGIKTLQDKVDVILIDTSGRLQNKKNLMEELKKMKRVAAKAHAGAPHGVWLILDSTLGQNIVDQARAFQEAVEIQGLVLTKLDGLSRGGTVFQVFQELKTPIYFLGYGEGLKDLEIFKSQHFIEELFDPD